MLRLLAGMPLTTPAAVVGEVTALVSDAANEATFAPEEKGPHRVKEGSPCACSSSKTIP